tara:strand:+ start:1348 stop:1638 length:291 start_codon:yes stop_codon:yes gene_type:complete
MIMVEHAASVEANKYAKTMAQMKDGTAGLTQRGVLPPPPLTLWGWEDPAARSACRCRHPAISPGGPLSWMHAMMADLLRSLEFGAISTWFRDPRLL